VHFPHVDRFVDGLTTAAAIARMLAHPPRRDGSGLSMITDFKCVLQSILFVELQEARDVHVQRTTVFARGQRQLLADAGLAAPRDNVVLELRAEVPQVVSTGLGAVWPSPHSEQSRM
jgi:hypothetical protein